MLVDISWKKAISLSLKSIEECHTSNDKTVVGRIVRTNCVQRSGRENSMARKAVARPNTVN